MITLRVSPVAVGGVKTNVTLDPTDVRLLCCARVVADPNSLPQLIQKLHPRIIAAAYPNAPNTAKPPPQLHRPGIARRYHVLLDSQYPLTTESLLGGAHQYHMYCQHCDYRITGITESRCPECGRRFNASDPSTFSTSDRAMRQRDIADLGYIVLLGIVFVVLVPFVVPVLIALLDVTPVGG